jgi:hypothetical protein
MKSDLTQTNYLKISEVFKSGLPITDTNQESPTFGQQIIKETGLKFGIRLSLIFDKENQFALPFEELSKYHNPLSRRENKSYLLQTPSGEKTVVPIAFGELDVKDQMLANFSIDQYDYPCLIKEMVDSIEFRSMFDYVFPMRRYLSLLTIYTANSFYDSIGNAGPPSEGGDRWTVPGGKRNGGFKNWDKEAVFHKKIPAGTSIVLMNSFLALYKTRNKLAPPAQNDDRDNEFNLAQILQQLIPTDIVADIPWWARRNRIDRPYDAFGNECVEEIDDDQI